jgi:hypothetical protein
MLGTRAFIKLILRQRILWRVTDVPHNEDYRHTWPIERAASLQARCLSLGKANFRGLCVYFHGDGLKIKTTHCRAVMHMRQRK